MFNQGMHSQGIMKYTHNEKHMKQKAFVILVNVLPTCSTRKNLEMLKHAWWRIALRSCFT